MIASRQPVLASLMAALLVAAAVMLVAGFGAAVGTGILIGILLGLVAVAVAVVVVLLRRSEAPWGVSLSGQEDGAEPGLLRTLGQASLRVADVDAGTLTNVIAVGDEASVNGVTVELVAAELRTHGGVVSLVAHTTPPALPPGHLAEVAVTDDAGTSYVSAAQNHGQSSPAAARFELRFAPAPPSAASELRIDIQRFLDPFPGTTLEPVEGPWTFQIPLGTREAGAD